MIKNKKSEKKKKKTKSREFKQLTLDERIKIELYYYNGKSFRDILKLLGTNRSIGTISNEVAGKTRKGRNKYSAYQAHEKALIKRGEGGKRSRLKSKFIIDFVVEKLKLGWSPEQIAIRLPIDYPSKNISYEAIYEYIYAQIGKSGTVKKGCEDLRIYLARRHKRRNKKGFRKGHVFPHSESLPSIEDRPKSVEKRSEVGDWEDDSIVSR